ncbi:uncharacterized protein PgNI_00003 [Pyricularia grisea]|uniref:Uncharacterized protein n=1 Tax=Pyricularia grisea TaxID=148305 RepID=A0A6P8BLJ2_PYRGI|nr:uncharacterized protein PgNI_00003 [Pyricularia grisea]TLD17520.1 hypothetical protein PgNI_00003 [Pyricularia grisea]
MHFFITAAIFFALDSAVNATPNPGNTLANLQTRQPISKTAVGGRLNANRPYKSKQCAREDEYCKLADDCCLGLLCGAHGCFELKYMSP